MPPPSLSRKSVAGLAVAGLVLAGCRGGDTTPAARVGSELISDQEVTTLTDQWKERETQRAVPGVPQPLPEKRLRQVAMLQLIKTKLVAQLAASEHVGVNADHLAGALAAETSPADLDGSGWGKASFETAMRSALLSKALAGKLFPSVVVPEDRVRAYFDTHPDQFQEQWKATVDLAFFRDEKRASEFSNQAEASEKFAGTARKLGADDVLTGQSVNKTSPLPTELLSAIPAMNTGTVSRPITAGRGSWVIHAADIRREGAQPFGVVKTAIEEHLADQERQAKFDAWLTDRLRQARITVKREYGRWPDDFI